MKTIEWLDVCKEIGKETCTEVMKLYKKKEGTEEVGTGYGGDRTMLADKTSEDIVIRELHRTGESIRLVSEEAGIVKIGTGAPKYLVYCDPLDGSFNFKQGIGWFGTAIAVLDAKTKEELVGYTKNFVSKSEYYAIKDYGAYKNGKKICTSSREKPENIMLECNRRANFDSIKKITDLFGTVRYSRMPGAVAIDYCKIACGDFDALLYAGASRYIDVVAGNFIVKEAGGVISDFKGNTKIYKGQELAVKDLLVCGNEKIRDYILGNKR